MLASGACGAEAASAVSRLLAAQAKVGVSEIETARVAQLIEMLRTGSGKVKAHGSIRRAEHELAEARRDAADARVAVAEARAELVGLLPAGARLPGAGRAAGRVARRVR